MGKRKYNAKGRQVNTVIVDNSETKKVKKVTFLICSHTLSKQMLILILDKIGARWR